MIAADIDDKFYNRADAFIDLANEHCSTVERAKVSASLMYSAARFNAWVSATGCQSGEQMRDEKSARIENFIAQYRAMLEENMDNYIKNFDNYMKPG